MCLYGMALASTPTYITLEFKTEMKYSIRSYVGVMPFITAHSLPLRTLDPLQAQPYRTGIDARGF